MPYFAGFFIGMAYNMTKQYRLPQTSHLAIDISLTDDYLLYNSIFKSKKIFLWR
jgi:hypothetical protein